MTSSHPLTSQAGTYRFAFAPFPSRHQIAEKHRKEFDMKNFARGALIAVAAVTVIGGYGAGAASAHPTGALDRLASVHQSSIENSFPHHPHHPIGPHRVDPNPFGHERGGPTERHRFNPSPWGLCPDVSPQSYCLPRSLSGQLLER